AAHAGVRASFFDHLPLGFGRMARGYLAARRFGVGALAKPLLSALSNVEILVLEKPAGKSA
ncbi:MAG TPA: hypothetical protein VHE37_06345, partial [Nevskiaceae bacterium]|nr:hypothetical protein [Nevskiaceae bacterium]